jgi:two-component sensor histidine kinase
MTLDVVDLAALADDLPNLVWMAEPEGSIYWFNAPWFEYTGTTLPEVEGWGWQSVLSPNELPTVMKHWMAAIQAGGAFEMLLSLRGTNGEFRPFLTRGRPIVGEDGQVKRWVVTNTDVSDQQRQIFSLLEEKGRLETLNQTITQVSSELELHRLVQIVTDAGVSLTGAQFGAFFYNTTDVGGDTLTLYTISGVDREHFSKFPNPRATSVFAPTFLGEGPVRSDDILADPRYGNNAPHQGMPAGHLPVRSYLAVSVRSRSGEVMGGLFFGHPSVGRFTQRHEELLVGIAAQAAIGIDNARLYDAAQREIAERREAERHRELLVNELNHRVKNTLATVQSVAAQTLRTSEVDLEVRKRLDARLIALSDAHNLLTEHNWEGATLERVAEMALRPYRSHREDRFVVTGTDVALSPKSALALSMALHELVTNAIKYGALSSGEGQVSVSWRVDEEAGGSRLHMAWTERGGPPVAPPSRRGFGSRLIERGLAADLDGRVELAFPVTGVVCTIDTLLPAKASKDG